MVTGCGRAAPPGHARPRDWDMLDTSLLSSIAKQLMSAEEVEVEGKRLPVRGTSNRGLRTVTFTLGGSTRGSSRTPTSRAGGAGLACCGHDVVEFKDVQANIVRVVGVDGEARSTGGTPAAGNGDHRIREARGTQNSVLRH